MKQTRKLLIYNLINELIKKIQKNTERKKVLKIRTERIKLIKKKNDDGGI